MFKTRLSSLLHPLLVAALPLLLATQLHAAETAWQQTLAEAKGQRVYFNAWGGSPEINAYLVWAGQELARDYQVTLVQVKVDDIAQSVSQLLASKQAGKTSGGPIDLLWVNGENFKALKEQGLLGAPFTDELPNMALVDTKLPVHEDFTLPVAGLEAPWGIGQLNLMVNTEEVTTVPTSAAELLASARTGTHRQRPDPQARQLTASVPVWLMTWAAGFEQGPVFVATSRDCRCFSIFIHD